jgi:Tfp pilus assembly protein PilF
MNQHLNRGSLAICLCAFLLTGGCATEQPGAASSAAPGKAINQYITGYQAYKRGQTETARQNLEAAVINNPNLRMARVMLGEIYRSGNDYNSAARQYEVLARIDPYTLNNHYYLGVSYQLLNRYKEATVAYLKGLKLNPQDFRSNMNLGTVYLALGNVDEAVRYLDKATQIDPQSATAWSNLGVALEARGSLVLAETSHRKALERNPDSIVILQNLANNLLAQRRTGEAIYFWEQVATRNPTPFTQTRLAEAYIIAADFSRAAQQLDSVLAREPRYLPAINAKAAWNIRQYELSGFIDERFRLAAIELMRRSLAMNGKQAQIESQLKKLERSSAIGP